MRALVGTGMHSRTLMEWVLRIMANLLRPDELGPGRGRLPGRRRDRPARPRRLIPYPGAHAVLVVPQVVVERWRLCPACGAAARPRGRLDARPRFRPADQEPFTRTSTFVLRRLSVGGSIVYQGHEGRIEANVVPEHPRRRRPGPTRAASTSTATTCSASRPTTRPTRSFTARAPDGERAGDVPLAGHAARARGARARRHERAGGHAATEARRARDLRAVRDRRGQARGVLAGGPGARARTSTSAGASASTTTTPPCPGSALVALPLVCLILFGRPARAIPQGGPRPDETSCPGSSTCSTCFGCELVVLSNCEAEPTAQAMRGPRRRRGRRCARALPWCGRGSGTAPRTGRAAGPRRGRASRGRSGRRASPSARWADS